MVTHTTRWGALARLRQSVDRLLAVGLCAAGLASAPARADDASPAETKPEESAPASPHGPHGNPHDGGGFHGFSIGADIQLHARFDLSYERSGYNSDPSDGVDGFKNYHRFVFLSRHAKGDPFFFNAEILGLSFYEIGYRFVPNVDAPWKLAASAGKILVPFGADPLFHHAYGGRTGADQRVLPLVWAEFGVKAAFDVKLDPVRLHIDAYAIRGHALRTEDAILDLQANASPIDDATIGGGGRIQVGIGPATINYSVYGSPLEVDQSVVLQALDVTLYRLPGVPFLEDLAVSLGVLRADVFGGSHDYYHFADYIDIRYYPLDWMYIQYRGGLDMRDNREGVFADPARLTSADTAAHSVSVGFMYSGFSFVIQHLWQLELVDEKPDDFLRLTAAYEF